MYMYYYRFFPDKMVFVALLIFAANQVMRTLRSEFMLLTCDFFYFCMGEEEGGSTKIMNAYNELSQKNRFRSVPIAALCLHNIQRENLVFENSLCIIYAPSFT